MEFYNVFDASDILPAVKTTRPFPYIYSKSEPCFNNEIDQECSICFEEYKEDLSKEICILPCYHLFHKQCYDNHIKSKFTDYLHSVQEGTWPEQPWPCNCPFNCSGQVKGGYANVSPILLQTNKKRGACITSITVFVS